MKKVLIFAIAAALLLAITVPGYSWTGRMAGMGNPYGLVEDESDFLTHPTAITQGKGWQYYGDFGLNYTKVTKWDMSSSFLPGTRYPESYGATGDEWANTASFGFTFPVNTGRMGLFINYAGNLIGREQYSGDASYPYWNLVETFDAKRDYDFFGIRAFYAQPFTNNVKFGGEFGISYKNEKNNTSETLIYQGGTIGWFENHFKFGYGQNLYPFMVPLDAKYWETNMKASVEGIFGASKLNVSVFGGFIFGGKSDYSYSFDPNNYHPARPSWIAGYPNTLGMDGNISGWSIGGEAWWRYTVSKVISLPFILRAEYKDRNRESEGTLNNYMFDFNHNEKALNILAGGGVDYRLSKGCGIAVGLYYNYLWDKQNISVTQGFLTPVFVFAHPEYPETREHRIVLKAAGEFALTPSFGLTTGLSFFYGWVKQDMNRTFYYNQWGYEPWNNPLSLDGHRWGLGLSVGGVFKFGNFTFEPYLNGGFQRLDVSGDGYRRYNDPITASSDDLKKNQWNVGGGFAIKFN